MTGTTEPPIELLPCPFCGHHASTIESGERWYVVCKAYDCFAALGEIWDRDAMPEHQFATEKEAITAWNSRAIVRQHEAAQGGDHFAEVRQKIENALEMATDCVNDPDLVVAAKEAIAAMNMGDCGSNGQPAIGSDGVNVQPNDSQSPASDNPREISVMEDALRDKLIDVSDVGWSGDAVALDVDKALEVFRPYLHPAPVNEKLVELVNRLRALNYGFNDGVVSDIATELAALASLPETKPVLLDLIELLREFDAEMREDRNIDGYHASALQKKTEAVLDAAGVPYAG